jgi:DNA mismatch repair protein MutS2
MAAMPFPPGAEVVVLTLRNKRGLVIEAGRNGRYRVRVEGITMSCREADLGSPAVGRTKKVALDRVRPRDGARTPGRSGKVDDEAPPAEAAVRPGRVDLHGLLVGEGIARVMDEIDRALQRGADRVEVLHGKGSGRMRDAVHRRLAELSVVRAFRLDPRNPGVTWVYF